MPKSKRKSFDQAFMDHAVALNAEFGERREDGTPMGPEDFVLDPVERAKHPRPTEDDLRDLGRQLAEDELKRKSSKS